MNNFLNTIPLPTIVVDKNLSILNVNESGLLFFDIKLDAICLKKITFIFSQLDLKNLDLKKDFELIYVNPNGIKYNLTIQFCSYLKDDIYGLFYIKQTSLAKSSSSYSVKKAKLLNQKLNVFQSFLNQIDQGVFIFNNQGQLIYLNENASTRFELKDKKKYYSWQLFDFFENESKWDIKKKFIERNKKIQFNILKFDSNSKDTTYLSVVINYQLIENKDYYVVTCTDTTSIEKDKFLISEKENQLNLFHKNIPAAIFEFVISGKESYFNYISNSFKKIFDFEIATCDNTWNSGIKMHPDDFKEFISTVKNIKKDVFEFKFTGRLLFNNKILWFETNATVTHKKELIILNGIVLNITEKKLNEEEVNNNRKFTDSVLFNIPADVAVFDKDHNYQFINSKGIANDELRNWMIGKNDFDYCSLKGIDTKLAIDRRVKFNVSKEKRQNVDWIDEIIKDGKKNYIFRRFYPYYDNNEFIYMIGYGVDVTELKEAQIQLEVQNKILIHKNQELERFTYIASHDLQEPLLSLISFSKLLEEEYSDKLDEDGKLSVQFINRSANRMRSLISGLMEYNRINLKENLNSFDTNVLIKEVLDDLSDIINRYGAKIKVTKLPTIPCYPTFIRILFQNLISNAIKFITKDILPNIEISCVERNEDWLFQIADNGIGINDKNLEEIFMIFKRLHKEETYAGHGIGLAHCKKIVEIHKGEIWVESIEGNGSTFYFTISKNI